ncbi:snf2 super family [Chrysochromulina tobinii]|uniref:Snf2 super family n=1 Tax=Chrysochromulina tobinii TaxID=1460289 RepID=A0A0M0JAS6_9EUKA|nr:snf2 super family [Chrysochromulina tobinii]|eukprot:KOO23699.1 snf2 super family [Chrysochromulina sp. CCMP291]
MKTTYPADRERTLEWALTRAGEAEEALGKEQYALADLEQPASLTCTLKGYQLDGLRWLAALHACGRSGILADEMGLGKTAQAIAMLALLRSRGVSGPFLVIAPLSTLSGWLEQLRSFCPSLHVAMYTGSATERAAVRRGPLSASSVLLASYEPVLADAPALVASCRFGYAVLDEAHRLKSRASAVYRLKAEHLHLPPKREVTIRVPMTSLQRHWYRAVLEKNRRALGGGANARSLVNVLAALRKCCNHPYLFEGVEPEPFVEGEHLVHAAAKLRMLDRLLVRLWTRGARVLLFSQSTMMLDVLQDYLHLRRWAYERLDGSARAEERWAAVAAFSGPVSGGAGGGSRAGGGGPGRETEPFVFLLSTRAGGLGLNLVAANTVIFYDHDWNPQADAQATDRVHRLGQTRPVLVVRLVCAGTVEEVILRRAHAKLLVSRGLLAEHAADLDVPVPSAAGSGAGAGRSAGVGVSAAGTPSQAAAAEAIRFGLASLSDGDIADAGAGAGVADSIYIFDGVDFAAKQAATPGLHVCLLVVLHRDKRVAYGTPPSLDTVALDTALRRLATAARRCAATVHSPRLSANGSSWYAVERLLRKNMRGVPTSIYYFKR